MEFKDKKSKLDSLANLKPKEILKNLLKATSGTDYTKKVNYSVYHKVVGFKPAKDGVGCSTIVASTALALAKLGLEVCVFDTSILAPCQDILLNTGCKSVDDWLTMPFTNSNVISVSRRSSGVNVLAFRGRTIVDLLSPSENEELVSIAIDQLYDKYDIILVDLANEPSTVVTACMQKCTKVIQVWSNSPSCLSNIYKSIENNLICCCSLDKMSTVITSCVVDDIPTSWNKILDRYKFKVIANIPVSLEVARILASGKVPFDYPSKAEGITLFNSAISDIVYSIIDLEVEPENFTGKTEKDIVKEEYDSDLVEVAKNQEVTTDKANISSQAEVASKQSNILSDVIDLDDYDDDGEGVD